MIFRTGKGLILDTGHVAFGKVSVIFPIRIRFVEFSVFALEIRRNFDIPIEDTESHNDIEL